MILILRSVIMVTVITFLTAPQTPQSQSLMNLQRCGTSYRIMQKSESQSCFTAHKPMVIICKACTERCNLSKTSINSRLSLFKQQKMKFLEHSQMMSLESYIGSNDCFVFSLKPELKYYGDTNDNQRYLLGEQDYFQIGGEGDGPAIWVNDTLEKGQTNCSATFANQLLNCGQKGKDEQFDIHNLEVYIL